MLRGERVDGKGLIESYNITRFIHENAERVFFTESFWFDETDGIFDCGYVEVIPKTVCRFTELTDKNGIEAFENDLITNPSGEKWVIKFATGAFVAVPLNKTFSDDSVHIVLRGIKNFEIIPKP
jgi:hypothetical protein